MIKNIEFDDRPMEVGEQRLLYAESDYKVAVEIKCFVQNPPPPGYKPCPSCGILDQKPGQPLVITASAELFSVSPGSLEITVRDGSGDEKHFSVAIVRTGGIRAKAGNYPPDGLPYDEPTKLRVVQPGIPKKALD
jgi:hypothetical protein